MASLISLEMGSTYFHVANQFVVFRHFPLVLELERLEDVDGGQLDVRDGVAVVDAHRGEVNALLFACLWGLLLCKAFQASGEKKQDEYYYVKPYVHAAKVHHSVECKFFFSTC